MEYKEALALYLTGKYSNVPYDNEPIHQATKIITTNMYDTLVSKYGAFTNPRFFRGIETKGNIGINTILILDRTDEVGSLIVILDDEFNIITTIDKYVNEQNIDVFNTIIIGDDGFFYATSGLRFLMLNNFAFANSQGEYKVILRQSYNIENGLANISSMNKAIGRPIFLFVGKTANNKPHAVEVKINVGTENTWTIYNYNGGTTNFSIYNSYAEWDSDNVIKFKIYAGTNLVNNSYQHFTIYYNSAVETIGDYTVYTLSNITNYPYVVVDDVLPLNYNTVYVGFSVRQALGEYPVNKIIRVWKFTDLNATMIFDTNPMVLPDEFHENCTTIRIVNIDNIIYYRYFFNNYTGGGGWNDTDIDLHTGHIINTTEYDYTSYNITDMNDIKYNDVLIRACFSVRNEFNLYKYLCLVGKNTLAEISMIFNINNYNGLPYSATNALIPKYANVYDLNNNIVFSRNAYNIIVRDNITITSTEVPSYCLNTVDEPFIKENKLFSVTNVELASGIFLGDKNSYEVTNVNFFVSLNVKDEVNTRLDTAIALVGGLSIIGSDFMVATKYKIIYEDETTVINNIIFEDNFINNYTYEYKIAIFVDKKMNKLQIISKYDEIIYSEIDISHCEIGKNYLIKQKMEVKDV